MLELDTVKEEINNIKAEKWWNKQFSWANVQIEKDERRALTAALNEVSSADLTYSNFFKNYLLENRPCLFTEEATGNWPSRTDFVKANAENSTKQNDSKINFEFLKTVYGNVNVTVTTCNDRSVMDYGGGKIEIMTIHEFIDYWERYINENYHSSMPCLYLKVFVLYFYQDFQQPPRIFRHHLSETYPRDFQDWHIVKESARYVAYKTPMYFESDWLNEAWDDKKNDDFRFAYLGPKGTWTPFHCDVYGSFSWSANIIGTKKWYIYPPGNENMFRGANGQLKFDYDRPGEKDVDYYEVIQEAGQIIFVPSGWHHIVWNLTDVISINHNWMNGANIVYIWIILTKALAEVKEEIKDLSNIPEFKDQCQLILKANHGMDYEMFFDIIVLIMNKRKEESSDNLFGPNHVQFDIAAIEDVIKNHILKDEDALSIIHVKEKWPLLLEYSKNILQEVS